MTTLFADFALLPTGWERDVEVVVEADGRIGSVTPGVNATDIETDLRLTGRVLLPSPPNLHSHTFQRAMAGMTEARGPSGRDSFWTWRDLMYRFLDRLTPEDIETIAALAFVEMLEAGYASVAEFHYLHHPVGGGRYHDPGETSTRIAAAAAASGIGLTHLPVLYTRGGVDDRPLEGGQRRFGSDFATFDTVCNSAAHAIDSLPDARLGVAAHSLRAVTQGDLARLAAERAGDPFHIHIAEQVAEVEAVEASYGARPVAWLFQSLPVDRHWCLIHATHLSDGEVRGIAESGAVAGLCPVTEANLGDGVFRGAEFAARDGALGVGTDSNIRIDLAEELRQLEYSQRLARRERSVMATPDQSTGRWLFQQVCAGGAQALGRDAGRIEPGAWADLLTLDRTDLALAGLDGDALLDAWVVCGDKSAIRDVWSAGRHVVREGRHIAREPIELRYRQTIAELRSAL
ncbi:MAG: formimidoylglutamate deiminase [Pseudomonadota bacterium]